jgi:hypothetical protein
VSLCPLRAVWYKTIGTTRLLTIPPWLTHPCVDSLASHVQQRDSSHSRLFQDFLLPPTRAYQPQPTSTIFFTFSTSALVALSSLSYISLLFRVHLQDPEGSSHTTPCIDQSDLIFASSSVHCGRSPKARLTSCPGILLHHSTEPQISLTVLHVNIDPALVHQSLATPETSVHQ